MVQRKNDASPNGLFVVRFDTDQNMKPATKFCLMKYFPFAICLSALLL